MAVSSKAKARLHKGSEQKRNQLMKWVLRFAALFAFIATCSWLDTIKGRWYVFDPTSLHQLAQEAVAVSGDDMRGMIDHIVKNLTATYPDSRIKLNTDSSEWMFNNAGGAMGAMYIIHSSITEYLIIFGTPLGTEGHTGIHTADDYFNILYGEQWAFLPGSLEKEVYPPGSVHFLPRGTVKQYKMHEGCFALEYARGWIPLMLPFGFMDTLTSTLDFPTFYRTARITAREMLGNLLIGKI
ncbi:ERG2 and sigma1 receptor-like protein [Gloeophyllum trabeum ATCC 11539]|uniref:C-8 sterol isomerase n=1 Tax=Gloeophyllum trabeum (strain ATCC 11539 / FP-39264 / Madison 617) TaxID=670483 RepID=S7PYA6_GLOTA|nr:ERG2 and sigma1 receptor-like protein [Gloeophyllum trabeum ATCC 11539]EPQ52332.1 ERG2 and sigma1 receptor-like protein [Gloeophyllum trabeum ATCC 11539]